VYTLATTKTGKKKARKWQKEEEKGMKDKTGKKRDKKMAKRR